jgi:hypothetical protein
MGLPITTLLSSNFSLTQRVMTLAKTQQIHPQIPPPNSLKHSTEAQPIIILTLTKGDL